MVERMNNNRETPDKSGRSYLQKMDAIAAGVQERIKETGFTRRVTDETVNIARSLGVPEPEIERWVSYRLARLSNDMKHIQEIKSLLDKSANP